MKRPSVIPEGSLIEVGLTIRLPRAATAEQITEWLAFTIGGFGTLENENPLSREEPESWGFRLPRWNDTGLVGREHRSTPVKTETGTSYTVQYLMEVRP